MTATRLMLNNLSGMISFKWNSNTERLLPSWRHSTPVWHNASSWVASSSFGQMPWIIISYERCFAAQCGRVYYRFHFDLVFMQLPLTFPSLKAFLSGVLKSLHRNSVIRSDILTFYIGMSNFSHCSWTINLDFYIIFYAIYCMAFALQSMLWWFCKTASYC